MNESNLIQFPGVVPVDAGVAPFGPLDSRRARRQRSLAAAASLAQPVAEASPPAAPIPLHRGHVAPSNAAEIARRQLLMSFDLPEPRAEMPPDLIA